MQDPHDADEAVQEALTRAWRQRASCRGDALPWILQITRNEALRVIARRRRRHEREHAIDVETSPAFAHEPCPDRLVEALDVRRAVSNLSDDERHLIAYRYVEDLTQPEVARRLEIPEGTVKIRLHRVRSRLRDSLEENV